MVGENNFYLSGVPEDVKNLPESLESKQLKWSKTDVTNFEKVIPTFDKSRVCLLDPAASEELSPEDSENFDFFLFGGILGDHPPRDRTGELRKHGFPGRHLGKIQMTTDTAVRVTQKVLADQQRIEDIDFIDFPELKFSKNESTEMPFRYVRDSQTGEPIMPEGMFDLIKEDSNKSLDDLIL
ncbi:uncharacterized protein SAPINGB_P003315 [Magnusiomyces paraingens]|uniref:Uncharacterized protein n=1 Tax=Magnusiomyces paraingens TaxID=2606893 RepID=A0A5E8BMK0_9ASCO|nr:uncharacterized protein SAPINGB_P003315 [Saprochaete ingens]VVT52094.1 unnamed protein product [Saprochaete ingens]